MEQIRKFKVWYEKTYQTKIPSLRAVALFDGNQDLKKEFLASA
jgi:hypothetical protein